ncbi:alginate export family protein [Litoribaculum gwangyangense]|uniref:Alginate export family protein n=1 Tax=Litoribaculum gwangyangense TaxID=1130722 RepID=A0ABP9CLH2_9FLAO
MHDSENLKVQGYLQFGSNAVAETNLFWNLADVPQLDYNSDTQWLESYVKPGMGFTMPSGKSKFYGKISAVASSTLGTDAFDEKNTGRITLEEAHLGYQFSLSEQSNLDVSVGSKELKLGTGMLIANGGVSGFERGALKFGPRKAWEMSAIGKLTSNKLSTTVFYINPNELPSNDTKNEIFGFDFNLNESVNEYIGISYVNVINSNAPYPQAAPNGNGAPIITFGAREDLNAINFYGKTYPFNSSLKNLFTALDFAYEWNDRIDMNAWGGRAQIGYDFSNITWRPTMMFSYQIFSGDDPDTPGLERFDPLYYEGSPSAWSTGSKSSMVFINSNVKSFGLSIRMMPSQKDIITFRYASIAAQQLNSPIQFGQAARVEFSDNIPTVVVGVSQPSLANDFFIEYNRIINRNIFFNAGFSMSFAGNGIENIVGDTSIWTGGFVNIVFNY